MRTTEEAKKKKLVAKKNEVSDIFSCSFVITSSFHPSNGCGKTADDTLQLIQPKNKIKMNRLCAESGNYFPIQAHRFWEKVNAQEN